MDDAQNRRKRTSTHEWPHEWPHESSHESTREGWFPCFQPFKDSPRNVPRRCPRKGPRVDGRGSPVLFSPVLFFDQFNIARTAPNHFLNNSRSPPNKTRALRQIAPESSPESSAKSSSHKFFGVPVLSLKIFALLKRGCANSIVGWELAGPWAPKLTN